jgi:hypothetical protein
MKFRAQPRLKGVTRTPRSTGLTPQMDAWIRAEQRRYGVSKSFVIANCVSYTSGIAMVSYKELDRERKGTR